MNKMGCLLVRLPRRIGAIFVLLIIGMLAFSSSAFLFRDLLRPSEPASKSQMGQRHDANMKPLHVITDTIDASDDSSVETSEIYSLGEKNGLDNYDTKQILTFQSSFERQSNPFVQLPPNIKLDEFLLHTDHLLNALNAGKSMHSKIVPKTKELLEEWTMACDCVGACPPNLDHGVIVSVRTAGISIPGLTVEWSALIGTNLVYQSQRHHNHQQYPELEFVLIKDESNVSSGAKPIAWIYNKLTRNRTNAYRSRSKHRSSSNMDTKLFTRLGFYEERSSPAICSSQDIDNDENESLVIRCAGTMEMKFRIPSMLGKLIFSSNGNEQKAKAERKMSNLITRQIEKDTEQNVLRWEENFRAWTSGTNEFAKGE
jgi:hypothetical protein